MNSRILFGLLIVLLILATASLAAPAWEGQIGQENGWPVVMNPAQPLEADQVLQPRQLWRMGADEEDILFGLVEDALVDEQGNTYLLDTVLSQVYVVDSNGEVLRTMAGEGDGPGEFRFAREMVFLPDGTLGIMEMMPGKVVSMELDGTPRPSFALTDGGQGMMYHLQHISANKNAVLIGKVVTNFGEGEVTTEYSLSSYDSAGQEQAVLLSHKEVQSGNNISLSMGGGENEFTSNFTVCPDGRVVVYQKAYDYELEVFDSAGHPHSLIRRDYQSVRRSDEELADARKQAEEMQARFNGSVEMEIPEYTRDISMVIPRANGDIWVANSQGDLDCPELSIGFFDVFDQDGRFVHRVRIEADFNPAKDNFRVRGNRLYVFKEAQNAPDRTSTVGGGGGMMVMMVSGGGGSFDEDEDEETLPYEVICYELPDK